MKELASTGKASKYSKICIKTCAAHLYRRLTCAAHLYRRLICAAHLYRHLTCAAHLYRRLTCIAQVYRHLAIAHRQLVSVVVEAIHYLLFSETFRSIATVNCLLPTYKHSPCAAIKHIYCQ